MAASDALLTQMRKGAVEYCVLGLLRERPHYGFELVQRLSREGGILTSEGTIYPLLSRLRREGMVETEWRESNAGPPRRYYRLTDAGRRALEGFQEQWAAFRTVVDRLVGLRSER